MRLDVVKLKGTKNHYNISSWHFIFYAWSNLRRQLPCVTATLRYGS